MGSGFAKALVEHGANVAIFDLSAPGQELVDAAKEHGVRIKAYTYVAFA